MDCQLEAIMPQPDVKRRWGYNPDMRQVQTIGCGVRDHIATISKLQADRKALTKQVKLLQQETAQSLGQSLAQRTGTQVSLLSLLGFAASDSAQVSIHDTAALALHRSASTPHI